MTPLTEGFQFLLFRNQIVDILLNSPKEGQIAASLPHPGDSEYIYNPKPIEMEPPVGHNTMMHCFQCPFSCTNLDFSLRRFPGFILDTVQISPDNDYTIAWGIELVEGKHWALLWVPSFFILLCSLLFGVTYTLVKKDIQGGFTVASYIAMLEASAFGSLQILLERP